MDLVGLKLCSGRRNVKTAVETTHSKTPADSLVAWTLGYCSRMNPCASSCRAQFSTAEASNSRSVRPVGSWARQSRVCLVVGLTILIANGAGPELHPANEIAAAATRMVLCREEFIIVI